MSEPESIADALALIRRHEQAIGRLRDWIAAQRGGRISLPELSLGQAHVAWMLLQGMTVPEMIKARGVTRGTISKTRAVLYAKLGVTRREDAVALLRLSGLDKYSGMSLESAA